MIRDPDLWHPTRGFRAVFASPVVEFNRIAYEAIRERRSRQDGHRRRVAGARGPRGPRVSDIKL